MERDTVYINRELSWLQFNGRVLEEARDASSPLMERMKFISIFGSNLDEFYMIRVGSLYDQTLLNAASLDSKSRATPAEQLEAVYAATRRLLLHRDETYKGLLRELRGQGIRHIDLQHMSDYEQAVTRAYFHRELLPLLSPQIVDKQHPFPFLHNKGIFLAAQVAGKGGEGAFCILPIDGGFDPVAWFPVEDGMGFLWTEEIILHYAEAVLRKYRMLDKALFRITRNADIEVAEALYDQDVDYRDVMWELLKKRKKLAPVRLQVYGEGYEALVAFLSQRLNLSASQVFVEQTPLDPGAIMALAEIRDGEHKKLHFARLSPAPLAEPSSLGAWFRRLAQGDVMLAVPYEPIRPLIRLLEQAAEDPGVVSIKITLYRMAAGSQIIAALARAAENGKEVVAVVELKARFDEENNLLWSRQLEEAGARVIYGLGEYKVHSKLLLITRRNGRRIERLLQVGTGNYNERTAGQYTDLMLFTLHPGLIADAMSVFDHLAIGELVEESRHLLVAPHCMKGRILGMIDGEIEQAARGKPARIRIKCNSVSDKQLIDKLLEASAAGVEIDMLVRGICCFKAGMPGMSENIRVRSIVGRYLEHSRIFVFGVGERQRMYISSADLMTRNMERRVEVAAPIYDPAIQARLLRMLDIQREDTAKTRVMTPTGEYRRETPGEQPFDSQSFFFRWVAEHPMRLKPQANPLERLFSLFRRRR